MKIITGVRPAILRFFSSARSARQHKDFHPSRDARPGTPAWGVSPRIAPGKMIKAREAGGSRIIWADVKRYVYHPLRGFD